MQTAARTTSLLASAGLLGALAIAGLTMSFKFTPPNIGEAPPPIVDMQEPTVPPPVPTHPHSPQPPPTSTAPAETKDIPTLPQVATTTTISDPIGSVDLGPIAITNPHWLRQPRDLQIYYPRRAIDRQMEGAAQLDCLVTTQGTLNCTVVSETPQGWGFGQAAIRISQDYRMVPAMRDGQPVEARYRMRVPFRLNG